MFDSPIATPKGLKKTMMANIHHRRQRSHSIHRAHVVWMSEKNKSFIKNFKPYKYEKDTKKVKYHLTTIDAHNKKVKKLNKRMKM